MTIQLVHIKVRDLFNGYQDNGLNGVVAYGGKLDVRPAYQREFVYNPEQQQAVIDTVSKGYPLNVMYWADQGGGRYELIDGQQRTLSICTFLNNDFSCEGLFQIPQSLQFGSLTKDQQDKLLNYELTVYICDGTESEKLEWFKTINIAGEELTNQELRNAVYKGSWISDAKRYFSKKGCAAYGLGSKYLKGTPIRQDYLETVIYWYGDQAIPKLDIEECMMKHQHKPNAQDLWDYFQRVIEWVETLFPTYRKEMKGLPWGIYYNRYHKNSYTPKGRRRCDQEERYLQVRPREGDRERRSECARHPSLRRQPEAHHLRAAGRGMPPLREEVRLRGDGGRPHHPLEQGRQD